MTLQTLTRKGRVWRILPCPNAMSTVCRSLSVVCILLFSLSLGLASTPSQKKKPLMRDFIGLNTHTIQFRTDLYRPVTRLVRDYHPVEWDLGHDPSRHTMFPTSPEGIDWGQLYGSWRKAGFIIDACAMFDSIPIEEWKDIPQEGEAYGESFAYFFGPSNLDLVTSIEIGNEPSKVPDDKYREMFQAMATGIRKGDPKMAIATCAVALGTKDPYSKDVKCLDGLSSLYDALNVHTYAFKKAWPTWERSNPEDPSISYLTQPQGIIDWRNQNAPGKQVWITEFGYDSTTKPNKTTGDFKDWVGVTDAEQAQFIVRSYLMFADMDIDRAYLYWFNDSDEPTLHASSGITRNYQPKPSYYAMAHLLKTLGNYRFEKELVKQTNGAFAFDFQSGNNAGDHIIAVWMATRHGEPTPVTLPPLRGKVVKAERMPLSSAAPNPTPFQVAADGSVTLKADGSPVYLFVKG